MDKRKIRQDRFVAKSGDFTVVSMPDEQLKDDDKEKESAENNDQPE